jgi:hypothetical protein
MTVHINIRFREGAASGVQELRHGRRPRVDSLAAEDLVGVDAGGVASRGDYLGFQIQVGPSMFATGLRWLGIVETRIRSAFRYSAIS